jgi:hypothetical protein
MNREQLRVTTEEQRERLHAARRSGRLCAACGRQIGEGETVYIEQFMIPEQLTISGRRTSAARAPVGVECASPELRQETEGMEPERCAGCGRPVYYRLHRQARHQALSSRACLNRASAAKRSVRTEEG